LISSLVPRHSTMVDITRMGGDQACAKHRRAISSVPTAAILHTSCRDTSDLRRRSVHGQSCCSASIGSGGPACESFRAGGLHCPPITLRSKPSACVIDTREAVSPAVTGMSIFQQPERADCHAGSVRMGKIERDCHFPHPNFARTATASSKSIGTPVRMADRQSVGNS